MKKERMNSDSHGINEESIRYKDQTQFEMAFPFHSFTKKEEVEFSFFSFFCNAFKKRSD